MKPGASRRWRNAAGWSAVGLNAAVACLWSFWGTIENFHEGWYSPDLGRNLLFTLAYLGPAILATSLGVLALAFPRVGAAVYLAAGLTAGAWVMRTIAPSGLLNVLLTLVMGGFGGAGAVVWWFGRPEPRRWAWRITWGAPLLVAVVCAAEPVWRVAHRRDDGFRGIRVVEGNGVRLTWAPQGPGWPRSGVTWDEAIDRCRQLSEDGLALMEEPQEIWRLPAVDEIVRSLTRGGRNAGGGWDAERHRASYRVMPDKEPPLWDPHSPIIYWWACDETGRPGTAWRVVYNGRVVELPRGLGMGSQGFRAVRDG